MGTASDIKLLDSINEIELGARLSLHNSNLIIRIIAAHCFSQRQSLKVALNKRINNGNSFKF